MKPLTTITILSRDPMDPETLTKVSVVTFESLGSGQIILTRDEMGVPMVESVTMKEDGVFAGLLKDTVQSLSELHTKLGELQMVASQATADMFTIHKWLNR